MKAPVADEFLAYGVAVGSLTLAEIEEWIEADPQSASKIDNERNNRPVFPLGTIGGWDSVNKQQSMALPMPAWSIPEGQSMNWWVYNFDNDAMSAGSQEVLIFANYMGVWLRD